jgi:hypothetical protein
MLNKVRPGCPRIVEFAGVVLQIVELALNDAVTDLTDLGSEKPPLPSRVPSFQSPSRIANTEVELPAWRDGLGGKVPAF